MNELFLTGIIGGVYCLGMCSSIVGILSVNLPADVRTNKQKIVKFQLIYNFGRILSYGLAGFIFASFFYILFIQVQMSEVGIFLRIFAGILMVLIGFFIAGFGYFIVKIEKLWQGLWQKLQPLAQKYLPIKSYTDTFLFGIFWGGIPCGLVYSALALTLSMEPVDGFLIMVFFGLDTLPSLLVIAGFGFGLTRFLKLSLVKKVAGIIIILRCWAIFTSITHLLQSTHTKHIIHR